MIDNRTVNNPFDISMTAIYNPSKLTHISAEIIKEFLPKGDRCKTCKLQLEESPPECLRSCPYLIHWGPGGRWKGYPMIETRKRRNSFKLHMKRSNLLFSYYNKLNFIFMGCFLNGLELDHVDGNPCNDNENNLIPALRESENIQRGRRQRKLQKRFQILWEFLERKDHQLTEEEDIELDAVIKELNEIKESKTNSRYYQLLVLMEKAIKMNKILIPPRSWWSDKSTSEITQYVIEEFNKNPDKYFQAKD